MGIYFANKNGTLLERNRRKNIRPLPAKSMQAIQQNTKNMIRYNDKKEKVQSLRSQGFSV